MYHTWREVLRADMATAQAAKDASNTGRMGEGGVEQVKENPPAAKIANEAPASH
jgi:hypothetical protein